ncbi:MAG: hypothetical protein WBP38_05505 [Hyphomicrobium sp.]|jgi:hypothetical protein|nr:hypothetical protein [Hyphomicrobium sp.]
MTATSTPCRWFFQAWLVASLAWLVFIAWRTIEGWPAIPLDMGGADPSTDAAYQAAQLQHVARAVGLAVAAPVVAFLMFKLVCRARRG